MKRLWIPALAALAVAALMSPSAAFGQVTYPDGVASGDVTQTRAILWTRVAGLTTPEQIKVEGWTNSSLSGPKAFKGKFKPTAARDWTVKIDVTGLQPGTQYWYRFQKDADVSDTGTFKTAPSTNQAADVDFVYSGDSDGTKVNGTPAHGTFEVLNQARQSNPDFFGYIGDTIYGDSDHRASGPATTVADYRATYRENRTYSALRDLLQSTSVYAQFDDHEVQNDYAGETVDPARYAAGRKAFLEYMPIRETNLPHDPSCAGDPLFRTFKWGSDLDVIVLDERSCRSAEAPVIQACNNDLGPTLPTAVRSTFPFSLFLPPNPPAGCLAALNNPNRTLLGPVQKQAFKDALLNSTAKHKVILNEVAIQQFYAAPYDRWEGYPSERNEILNFIRSNGIENVTFLTTDSEANIVNEVFIDRFTDQDTIANELVTGPIAQDTLEELVFSGFGFLGVFAFNSTLNVAQIDCRDIDQFGYGTTQYSAAAGTLNVALKDETGALIQDQNVPSVQCTKTFGP